MAKHSANPDVFVCKGGSFIQRWLAGLALPFALVALLVPDRGDACGTPRCFSSRPAPRGDAGIPSNVPAIAFAPGVVEGQSIVVADGRLRLVDSSDFEIASTIEPDQNSPGEFLVRPQAPLTPGEFYRIEYPEPCTGEFGTPGPDGGAVLASSFVAESPSSLPASVGALSVQESAEGKLGILTVCGRCERDVDVAFAKLSLTPTPELVPYLPVTRFILYVDGEYWAEAPYGSFTLDGGFDPRGWRVVETSGPTASQRLVENWITDSRRVDLVYARCHRHTDSTEDDGVMPGAHTAQLVAEIAGTSVQLVSIAIAVDLQCFAAGTSVSSSDQCVWNGTGPKDGGFGDAASDGDAGKAASDAGPAADMDAGMVADGGAGPNCGCAADGGNFPMEFIGFLAGVACLGARRRQRDERTCRKPLSA